MTAYGLLRPLLFALPAETAHRLGVAALRRWPRHPLPSSEVDLSVTLAGLRFPNPLGIAAGFDKDAEMVEGLFALGFGSVEVGTVTPRPQPGNPRPRLFRVPSQRALINRMGFNNQGAEAMARRLEKVHWRPGPVGVNIGRNKDTPNERAADDYVACARRLAPLADYLVVNASSPNTPGLRDLQEPEALSALLAAVRDAAGSTPLFAKIAPDLSPEAIRAAVDVCIRAGAIGVIATNTTISRPFPHAEAGGLSGAPLRAMSTDCVRIAATQARGRLAVIGVGGVFDGDDAFEKLAAGASLVQSYTGFVYGGPDFAPRLLKGLASRLRREGATNLQSYLPSR